MNTCCLTTGGGGGGATTIGPDATHPPQAICQNLRGGGGGVGGRVGGGGVLAAQQGGGGTDKPESPYFVQGRQAPSSDPSYSLGIGLQCIWRVSNAGLPPELQTKICDPAVSVHQEDHSEMATQLMRVLQCSDAYR